VTGTVRTNLTGPRDEGAAVDGRGGLALAVAAAIDQVPGVRRTGGQGVDVSTQYAGGRLPRGLA
jgi:hypothetical protein